MTEVKICDVSLRDGMQVLNRHAVIPLDARLQLVDALIRANVPSIEIGSFVNPHVVPAMADTRELLHRMPPYDGQITCLVPSLKYYDQLKLAARVNTVALFVSASEDYARKNTRMTVDEAVDAAGTVAEAARADGYRLRGYLSFAFRDPSMPDLAARRIVRLGEAVDYDPADTPSPLIGRVVAAKDASRDALFVHTLKGEVHRIRSAEASYKELNPGTLIEITSDQTRTLTNVRVIGHEQVQIAHERGQHGPGLER